MLRSGYVRMRVCIGMREGLQIWLAWWRALIREIVVVIILFLRGYFPWWLRGLDSVGLAGGLALSLWVINTWLCLSQFCSLRGYFNMVIIRLLRVGLNVPSMCVIVWFGLVFFCELGFVLRYLFKCLLLSLSSLSFLYHALSLFFWFFSILCLLLFSPLLIFLSLWFKSFLFLVCGRFSFPLSYFFSFLSNFYLLYFVFASVFSFAYFYLSLIQKFSFSSMWSVLFSSFVLLLFFYLAFSPFYVHFSVSLSFILPFLVIVMFLLPLFVLFSFLIFFSHFPFC